MAGREVQRSAAYRALSDGGQRVLKVIEDEVRRGGSAISLDTLMDATGLCRSSVRRGIRQCELVEFIAVSMGPRHNNLFKLADGWRNVDKADEAKRRIKQAKLPTPPRQISAPPRAVRPVKARVEVEQPPPRAAPSMPVVAWVDGTSRRIHDIATACGISSNVRPQ
jgi:hypothetical protein